MVDKRKKYVIYIFGLFILIYALGVMLVIEINNIDTVSSKIIGQEKIEGQFLMSDGYRDRICLISYDYNGNTFYDEVRISNAQYLHNGDSLKVLVRKDNGLMESSEKIISLIVPFISLSILVACSICLLFKKEKSS